MDHRTTDARITANHHFIAFFALQKHASIGRGVFDNINGRKVFTTYTTQSTTNSRNRFDESHKEPQK